MKAKISFMLLFFMVLVPREGWAANYIEKVQVEEEGSVFLTIRCRDEITAYESFRLTDPERYVIDIQDAQLGDDVATEIAVSRQGVRAVRAGNHESFARIVIDFSGEKAPESSLLKEGNILRIALAGERPSPVIIARASASPSTQAESPVEETKSPDRPRGGRQYAGVALAESTILPPQAPSPRRTGSMEVEGRLSIKYSRDLGEEDEFESQNDVRGLFLGGIKYTFSPQNYLKAGVRYRYLDESGGTGHDYSKVVPGEIYLNLAKDHFYLGLGTQIVRWGQTDEISPIDVINPEDLTELFVNRRADRKIAAPMVRLGLLHELINLEAVYLPLFVGSEIEFMDSDWAVFPQFRERMASLVPPPVAGALRQIDLEENEPETSFENGEFGVRATRVFPNLDLGLSYFYGWEKVPLPEARTPQGEAIRQILVMPESAGAVFSSLSGPLSGEDLTFDLEYQRFHLIGLDLATTWMNVGFRGEAAYFMERSFLLDSGAMTSEDVVHLVIGADYNLSDALYLNVLYSHDRVIDSEELALRPRTQQDLIGNLEWDMWKDDLTFKVYAFYSFSDGSVYCNPSVTWKSFDNFNLETGVNLLWAEEGDILFPYRNNDNFFIQGSLFF